MLAPWLGGALFLNQQVKGIRVVKEIPYFLPFVISSRGWSIVLLVHHDPSFGLFNMVLGCVRFGPISILADEDYVTYGIITLLIIF
ncbi:hypothetical protein O9993_10225 [Vibrio lentus]|nr:hypothetical protein [Vibrio lentus]